MNVAISIDWDYVTDDCSGADGHCGFCANAEEGGVGIRGNMKDNATDWRERLSELRSLYYPEGIPVYVAECHAEIFGVLRAPIGGKLRILDYDAHYDDYPYEERFLSCGNWIKYARQAYNAEIVSRNDYGDDFNGTNAGSYDANMVFICKSSPWTPKEMDRRFYELVRHVSRETGTSPIFIGHRAVELEREYRNRRKL